MLFVTILVYILIKINLISGDKIWIQMEPEIMKTNTYWQNDVAPCDYDEVVFSKKYPAALFLSKNLAFDSLVLPRDGVLIFGQNLSSEVTLALTNGAAKDKAMKQKCIASNNSAQLKLPQNITRFWFDPANWKSIEKQNFAAPDLERVPCSYDVAILPDRGSLSIDFENIDTLEVNGIEMGGVNTTWKTFQNDLYSDMGHIIFREASDFNVVFNNIKNENEHCACHSPTTYSDYKERVCNHVKQKCISHYPRCLNPIKPHGHCCEICGAVLTMTIDDCKAFDLKLFNKFVQDEIIKQGIQDEIDFHASKMFRQNLELVVQLIITDRYDYNEVSTNFMAHFNRSILEKSYLYNAKGFQLSGIKYDKKDSNNSWKYVITPLLFTILFFTLIYLHYVSGHIQFPNWSFANRFGIFNSSFVFARFDNHHGDLEIVQNLTRPPIRIESLGENENNETIENDADAPRAFDNPMFDEMLEVPKSQNAECISLASDSTELIMISLDEN